MPKTYEELTYANMEYVRTVFEREHIDSLNRLIGNTRYVRVDKGTEYFVIEYYGTPNLSLDPPKHAPDVSINIKNDFSIVITGLEPNDELMANSMVLGYLKAHDFIR